MKSKDEPIIPAGKDVVIGTSGKVKKSGTVTIDGYKYKVTNYVAVLQD